MPYTHMASQGLILHKVVGHLSKKDVDLSSILGAARDACRFLLVKSKVVLKPEYEAALVAGKVMPAADKTARTGADGTAKTLSKMLGGLPTSKPVPLKAMPIPVRKA